MPPVLRATLAVATVMLVLDLGWLGWLAADLYDRALGPLRAPSPNALAAALFYAMYVGVVVGWAALPAATVREAAARGAGMGFLAYATYELTNWAVLRDWPAWIVPIDVAWGVALTATAAAAGRRAAA